MHNEKPISKEELKSNIGYIEPSGNDLINEELEAFERIKNITYDRTDLYGIEVFRKDLDIIRRALKRLNYIDENKLYCISENYLQDIKKIKAFKLIKEKMVNVGAFMKCCLSLSYEEYIKQWGNWHKHIFKNISREVLTQEEYDLLKEVLVNNE